MALAELKKRLPDDYTVFHGVHWLREYARWTHFGEVDFVVVNRGGDVLLIEQKDGDLAIDYLIYCPDHRVVNVNAAALDMGRIVDAAARDGLAGRIKSVLGPGVDAGDGLAGEVLGFFRQTLELVPDIHAHIDAQERAFVRQVGGLEGFVGYRAQVNYRSPDGICRFIKKTLPFELEAGNDLPGLGVGVHGYDDPGDQPALAARVVKGLIERGFAYDDIVVLACRGVASSVFSERDKVGNVPLRRFTGEYDLFGNQVLTEGRLTFRLWPSTKRVAIQPGNR